MTKTAVTYGDSLYELAEEEKITDVIFSEMKMADEVFRENPDYIRILREPSIAKKDRLKLIDEAFSEKVHMYLLSFMKILVENDYIGEFSGCMREFARRYNLANGISEALVTSAVRLDENQKKALVVKLEKISGKKVILKEKIDERSIAGLKVEMDGKQYDGTVSGRIRSIEKKVSDIIV